MKTAYQAVRAAQLSEHPQDHVELDLEGRQKRRIVHTSRGGEEFLVNLPRPENLGEGDAFLLEDGRLIGIKAAAEALYEIRGRDMFHLLRLAWHLGNRHLATEITADALYIREDHVICDMLKGLGAEVTPVQRAFQPESGAYAGSHSGHSHDHHGHHHHD